MSQTRASFPWLVTAQAGRQQLAVQTGTIQGERAAVSNCAEAAGSAQGHRGNQHVRAPYREAPSGVSAWVMAPRKILSTTQPGNSSGETEGCGLSACHREQVGDTHCMWQLRAVWCSRPWCVPQRGLALLPPSQPVEMVLIQLGPARYSIPPKPVLTLQTQDCPSFLHLSLKRPPLPLHCTFLETSPRAF